MICGSRGRKVTSLKRRAQSHLARWEMKNCTPLWREAHFQNAPLSDHFWKLRCRKSGRHCGAKHMSKSKCTKHTISDHFWKLRCRKSARHCRAKNISKSKCTKHTSFGPLLEVEMSKKCSPLSREEHFQVKMYKAHQLRTTFGSWDVEKVLAIVARSTFPGQKCQKLTGSDHFLTSDVEKVHTVEARSTFPSQTCQKLTGSDHFFTFRGRKSARWLT